MVCARDVCFLFCQVIFRCQHVEICLTSCVELVCCSNVDCTCQFQEVVVLFHGIIYVQNHVICELKQFYFLLSDLSFFFPLWNGQDFQQILNNKRGGWLPQPHSWSLGESMQIFSIKQNGWCRYFSKILYIQVKKTHFCSLFAECFYHEWLLSFVKCFL